MNPSATRLTGRTLRLARLLWLALALSYGCMMVASTPTNFTAENEARILANNFRDWSPPQISQAFADLHLSQRAYIDFALVSNVLLGPSYFVLGLFLFWRRSDDWLALLFSVTFITALSTGSFSAVFGPSPLVSWLGNLSDALTSTVLFSVLLVFPDGRFRPRWTRWVLFGLAAVQFWRVFFQEAYDSLGLALALPIFPVAAFSLLYRYFRAADPVQRQQIKWVAFGTSLTALPLTVFILAFALVPGASQRDADGLAFQLLGTALWTSFLILWPAGLIISILRYRLWDIDVLIRRTLIYSALSALLGLLYLGSILVLQNLFRTLTGQDQGQLVTVLSTLIIAALFVPLRARVQRTIDRRFYRQKYNAAHTLAEFAAGARDEVALDRISERLVSVVDEAMRPAHVGLWLRASRGDQKARR